MYDLFAGKCEGEFVYMSHGDILRIATYSAPGSMLELDIP